MSPKHYTRKTFNTNYIFCDIIETNHPIAKIINKQIEKMKFKAREIYILLKRKLFLNFQITTVWHKILTTGEDSAVAILFEF